MTNKRPKEVKVEEKLFLLSQLPNNQIANSEWRTIFTWYIIP